MGVAAETNLELRAPVRAPGLDLIAAIRSRPVESDLIARAAHTGSAADQRESSGAA
jgi:hypothetical protein